MSVSRTLTTCACFCSHCPQRRRASRLWLVPPLLLRSATYVTVPGPFGRSGTTVHHTNNGCTSNLLYYSNNNWQCITMVNRTYNKKAMHTVSIHHIKQTVFVQRFLAIHISWSKSCLSVCTCLYINQGGINRNRCIQRPVLLHAPTH